MKRATLDLLVCPECHGADLDLDVFRGSGEDVDEGRIICHGCDCWFRIEESIPDLLPLALRRHPRHEAFADRNRLNGTHHNGHMPSRNSLQQISFFARYHAGYETEVVRSAFYRLVDIDRFAGWVRRSLQPGQVVLELGCGSGRQSLPIAARGVRTIGLDVSEEMVRMARYKLAQRGLLDRAEFIVASADDPPVRHDAFDASVLYGGLHHFDNPPGVIREAAARLRLGGTFYILENHASPLRPLFDQAMRLRPLWQEEAGDSHTFSQAELGRWLTEACLEPRFSFSTYLPPHLWYFLPPRLGLDVLRVTDGLCGRLPGVKHLAGLIVAEGIKTAPTPAWAQPTVDAHHLSHAH
ncbi:MAG: methyltransferase domain-containing protein [Chloroflexi bacterium]|nr:methyltransferase domain-containing protein [Chloroflexota bacterium]